MSEKVGKVPQPLENTGFAAFSAVPENLRDMSGKSGKGMPSSIRVTRSTPKASARERKRTYEDQQDQRTSQVDVYAVAFAPTEGKTPCTLIAPALTNYEMR